MDGAGNYSRHRPLRFGYECMSDTAGAFAPHSGNQVTQVSPAIKVLDQIQDLHGLATAPDNL
jgi:hypothetical protein